MLYRLLGPLEVSDGDRPVRLGEGRLRSVLILLLLHRNEAMVSERVIDALWGESPPATAAKVLQNYVGQLRRALDDREGRRLQTRGHGYAIRVEDGELDLDREPPDSPARTACRELHDTLYRWMEITPARVVNRASAMASNGSKPYQAQLIARAGFAIPETLVTNDPELVRAFFSQHGRVVYKSVSGSRSVVQELTWDDFDRIEDIRWCPVQFQAYVAGVDVRVHVVGRQIFATRVTSEATDYRYAGLDGGRSARLEATTLDDETAERCIDVTRELGLRFSGIDLRMTPEGEAVCFEVNPSPAYAYYEGHTGQPIAAAVARHLAGAAR